MKNGDDFIVKLTQNNIKEEKLPLWEEIDDTILMTQILLEYNRISIRLGLFSLNNSTKIL